MSSVFYRSPGQRYRVAGSAGGVYISDQSGRQYLDMSGGAAVSILGHGQPDVLAALHAQLDMLDFAHTAFFTHPAQEQLADRITALFGDPGARVYFTCGGSEANETALKAAWQYHRARGEGQRKIIISREHSYHGNTFGTLSVSGNPLRRAASAAPLLDWPRIAPCYPLRYRQQQETPEAYALRAADELEAAIMQAGPDQVAAFIIEPVVGSSLGAVAAEAGYLQRVREICDRHGLLLIFDEIMCGSGRTGTFFAHQHEQVRPDIVTLGKGISAGYAPLAATVFAAGVASVLEGSGFAHGHTYVAHPLSCAAGLAVLEVMQRDDLLSRCRRLGLQLGGLLSERFAGHPQVAEVRGRGLFWALELVSDRVTLSGFSQHPGLEARLREAALQRGLIVYPGSINVAGATVPHILLAPPMTSEPRHFEQCAEALEQVFKDVLDA